MAQYRHAALLGRRARWDRIARLHGFNWWIPAGIAVTVAFVALLITGVSVDGQITLPIRYDATQTAFLGKPENTTDIFVFGRNEQACGEVLTFKAADPAVLPAFAETDLVRIAPSPSSRRYFTARVDITADTIRLIPGQVCRVAAFKPGLIETGAPAVTVLTSLITGERGG